MRISAIVPVKRYTQAKSRLDVSDIQRVRLCHAMLYETLDALNRSPVIHEIVVVTDDVRAQKLSGDLGATTLRDNGTGVNEAVRIANRYLADKGAAMSLVIPADVPLMEPADISFLLKFFTPPECVLVVPSMRLDGTNALLRCPPDVMGTSYDNNSYRNHMDMARRTVNNYGLVYIPRIMNDVDTLSDLEDVLDKAKPELYGRLMSALHAK